MLIDVSIEFGFLVSRRLIEDRIAWVYHSFK